MLTRRLRTWMLVPALALVAILASAGTATSAPPTTARAAPAVPHGFVGMMIDGPLLDPKVDLSRQLDAMVAYGVENVRVAFSWAAAQPYRSWRSVPHKDLSQFQNVNGIPTSFAASDQLVALAAQHGLSVLPVVLYTPAWDAARHPPGTYATPRSVAPFGNFVAALARRYGPHGAFWREHPGLIALPIRRWEIWNEPDQIRWWPAQPFMRGYVALMAAAHRAIKTVDRRGQVVLAGMPNYVWITLAQIYAVRGARRQFDVVAVHPYTSTPAGVIKILTMVRQTMDAHGDSRKPILATEIGWPSSLGKAPQYGFETTQSGQASKLAALMPMLAGHRRALRLLGFDYYTWVTDEHPGVGSFSYAGLFHYAKGRILAKPAAATFRREALALEGCRQKGPVATSCVTRG
jgi:hypothetical protein